jgi:hypothetical protein
MNNARENAVYNSPIAEMHIPSSGCSGRARSLLLALCLCWTSSSRAADWSTPIQELGRKIASVTGTGTISYSVLNRSSLSKQVVDDISRVLRSQLEAAGVHTARPEQAATTVVVSLSENLSSYVWVAEIHRGPGGVLVAMVSAPRPALENVAHAIAPMTIRKTPLWAQEQRILDLAVLEESTTPTRLAVLDPDYLAIYRFTNGRWQEEQRLSLSHAKPWPRDMRGRLVLRQDRGLDVYLPGVLCRGSGMTPISLSCHESDDPWPLSSQYAVGGFFTPTRNFFTGVLAPGVGEQTSTAKFYSAAPIPRQNSTWWMFAMVDGTTHLLDGTTEQTQRPGWGSDLAGVRTSCGSGWQVLATQPGSASTDAIRAYETPDRDPVPVSAALDLTGGITALWTEGKGTSAIAVTRNAETGTYEAFRMAVVCGQ